MKRITQVFKYLMVPDDQGNNWYDWATNQISHAFLGVVFTVALGPIPTIIFSVSKELLDIRKSFNIRTITDSAEDLAFWFVGCGIIADAKYFYLYMSVLAVLMVRNIYIRTGNA